MKSRRDFLKTTGGMVLATGGTWLAGHARAADSVMGPSELPDGTLSASILEALPGKVPLIKKSWRPPNYETPVSYFNDVFTPNDAFFVRYHLSNIPEVAAATWRLKIGGEAVDKPLELTLESLRNDYEQVEVAAVCQCSGNRRGMFQPHVPGVEWGPGAMGNARWKGARLKDVLAKAGLKKEALEIVFDGADSGVCSDDARFRQVDPGVEGAGREHPDRLANERPATAALEWIPGADHRPGMDGNLLDEAGDEHQRHHQAL